jgi:Tfp pilus assembly protein PilF
MSALSVERLQAQCGGPRDGALLRLTLGNALAASGDVASAVAEFERALAFDPGYSAAWRALGRARLVSGAADAAADAFERGIAAARARGDLQACREMQVFLGRLRGPSK